MKKMQVLMSMLCMFLVTLLSGFMVSCDSRAGDKISESSDISISEDYDVESNSDAIENLNSSEGEEVEYTVTFMTDDVVYKTVKVEEGYTVVLPNEPTAASGYSFGYWLNEDESKFIETKPITENITLYAVWLKNYEVRFLDENGLRIHIETVKEGSAPQFDFTIPTKETEYSNFTFEKWTTKKGGDEEADLSAVMENMKVYAKYTKTPKFTNVEDILDYVIEIPAGRAAKILQLTDTQLMGSEDDWLEQTLYRYVRQAVQSANFDLILLTGDLVYGQFDNDGIMFTKLIAFMEGLNIPWAPVFGNHDNESTKGVQWQCQQLENAENCLFVRRDLSGNGNYNIGIKQDNKIIKVIYMLDSNGCAGSTEINEVKRSIGFGEDQIAWLEEGAAYIDVLAGYEVSKFIGFHIPIAEFAQAAYEAGYQSSNDADNSELYIIGTDVTAVNGDFGHKGEVFKNCHEEEGLWEILKANGFDGVFVGHSHLNNVSILYDGIRLTFGLKTGENERGNEMGGTAITIAEGNASFSVEHIYVDFGS